MKVSIIILEQNKRHAAGIISDIQITLQKVVQATISGDCQFWNIYYSRTSGFGLSDCLNDPSQITIVVECPLTERQRV